MHQTKYRGIITEGRIIDVSSLGASGFPLVKPLRKSVNPFGGDLCFGWLGSLRLYLYKPLGCVSTFWKWMPAGKDILLCITKDYLHGLTAVLLTSLSASMSAPILHGCLSPSLMGLLSGNPLRSSILIPDPETSLSQK